MQPEADMPKSVVLAADEVALRRASPESAAVEPERMLSTGEVAAFLGVNVETVRRYRESWGLPHIRLPSGRCRYPEGAFRRWVARHFKAFGEFE